MAKDLQQNVSAAIRTVESDEDPRFVATFWLTDHTNIGIGIADTSEGDEGLSVQVEVVAPREVMNLQQLEPRETLMKDINAGMKELNDDLVAAIEDEVGHEPESELLYLGEPETKPGVNSVLFDATIREAE